MNARVLGWFFTSRSDVNVSMFDPTWADDVSDVARKIETPVSIHLSHGTAGAKAGEMHPGEWPILELAVVLDDGLARFFDHLDPNSATCDRGWFTPSLRDTYDELMQLDPLAVPTSLSDNQRVRDLTVALQEYLRDHGLMP